MTEFNLHITLKKWHVALFATLFLVAGATSTVNIRDHTINLFGNLNLKGNSIKNVDWANSDTSGLESQIGSGEFRITGKTSCGDSSETIMQAQGDPSATASCSIQCPDNGKVMAWTTIERKERASQFDGEANCDTDYSDKELKNWKTTNIQSIQASKTVTVNADGGCGSYGCTEKCAQVYVEAICYKYR